MTDSKKPDEPISKDALSVPSNAERTGRPLSLNRLQIFDQNAFAVLAAFYRWASGVGNAIPKAPQFEARMQHDQSLIIYFPAGYKAQSMIIRPGEWKELSEAEVNAAAAATSPDEFGVLSKLLSTDGPAQTLH